MVSIVSAQRPRRAALVFIFVTIALDMMAIGLIVPVLPKLVEDFMHEDTAAAARVFGVFGVGFALNVGDQWNGYLVMYGGGIGSSYTIRRYDGGNPNAIATGAGRSSCCRTSVSGSTTC